MFSRSSNLMYAVGILFGAVLYYQLSSLGNQVSVAITGREYSADRAREAAAKRRGRYEWQAVIEAEMASRENQERLVLASYRGLEVSDAEEWQLEPEKWVIERNLQRAAKEQMVVLGPVRIVELELNETYPTAKTLLNIDAEVFPYTDSTMHVSALMYHDGLRWRLDDLSGYERQN